MSKPTPAKCLMVEHRERGSAPEVLKGHRVPAKAPGLGRALARSALTRLGIDATDNWMETKVHVESGGRRWAKNQQALTRGSYGAEAARLWAVLRVWRGATGCLTRGPPREEFFDGFALARARSLMPVRGRTTPHSIRFGTTCPHTRGPKVTSNTSRSMSMRCCRRRARPTATTDR
jgi:hypothetical protein